MDTKTSKPETTAADLRRNLDRLRDRYSGRTDHMNRQSIWLFLATLGCWSVSQPHFQLLGLVVTLLLYFHLAVDGLQIGTPARDIRGEIESGLASPDVSTEERRARTQEYDELEKSVMSAANFKRSWLFWLTFTYWGASVVYFVVQLVRSVTGTA